MHADELEEIEQRTNYSLPGDSLARAYSDESLKNAVHTRNLAFGVALAEAAVLAIAVFGCIHLGAKAKTVPMVFFTDRQGNVWSPGAGQEAAMDSRMWDRVKQNTFAEFVRDWRTVTPDPVYLQRIARNVSAHVGDRSAAKSFFDSWYTQNPVPVRATKEQVSVDIVSAQPVTDKTYQVQWRERIYKIGASDPQTDSYSAIFTYVVESPTKDVTADNLNPLGVLITQVSVSQNVNQ